MPALRAALSAVTTASPKALVRSGIVPAAVLLPIIVRPEGLSVLLTLRCAHLRDHAGQISFPGGRCDADDASPIMTALRETHEEVGLAPEQIEVLACLPDQWIRTGFLVSPVVGLVQGSFTLRLDRFEVAEAFELPLNDLLDPARRRVKTVQYNDQMHSTWEIVWPGRCIWGATAAMLIALSDVLDAAQPPSP